MTVYVVYKSILIAHIYNLEGYYMRLKSLRIIVTDNKLFIKKKVVLFSVIVEIVDCIKNLLFLEIIFNLKQDIVLTSKIECKDVSSKFFVFT